MNAVSVAVAAVVAWAAAGARSAIRHPVSSAWVATCTAWLALYLATGGPAW